MPWIVEQSDPESVMADLEGIVLPYLLAQGVTRTGLVGFCFGGYVALLASASQRLDLMCAAGVHSSAKIFNLAPGAAQGADVEAASKVLCPQMMIQAGNDADNTKPGGAIEEALNMRSHRLEYGASTFVEFPDMIHGWVLRGDLGNELVRRDVAAAMGHVVSFLANYLSDEQLSEAQQDALSRRGEFTTDQLEALGLSARPVKSAGKTMGASAQ
jgi:dienelactone hydrolase